jgi:hypothetical protein
MGVLNTPIFYEINIIMNTYVKSFETVNESIQQYGIVLIKGKPRGKNGERMLYAAHINGWAELRPGAVMLFLSDNFYRIIQEDGRLKGVKIGWQSEDSLKAVLNFKSPGKISVVRNNNKTPYHWKTLKYTNLYDALADVKYDILSSDYILESADSNTPVDPLYTTVLSDAVDSIFKDGKNVILLDWKIPKDPLMDSINNNNDYDDEDRGSGKASWDIELDCLYVGQPELDEKLKALDLRRFWLTVELVTEFKYTSWYDPGDRDTPPDGDTEITSANTEVDNIYLGDYEFEDTFGLGEAIDGSGDLLSFIQKKHSNFIS